MRDAVLGAVEEAEPAHALSEILTQAGAATPGSDLATQRIQ